MTTEFDFKTIQISLLDFNKGQLDGLPKNPRFFRDYRYDAMKKSIEDSPEMLNLRELIVYPVGERYIVVCGNLRLRACKELGYKELPCKVLNPETPVKKLREYATKDNVSFGENDMDVMMNDWDKSELQDWGIEFAPERMKLLFIHLYPSMMKNMSYSSLCRLVKWIATGYVKHLTCSTCRVTRPAK